MNHEIALRILKTQNVDLETEEWEIERFSRGVTMQSDECTHRGIVGQ